MSRIRFKSRASYKGIKTEKHSTLLDSGAHCCYIDMGIANILGINANKLHMSHVGLGYRRKRWGPFQCGFIVNFGKRYMASAKTYVTDFKDDTFDILLSGNYIKRVKLPIHKMVEREEAYEY